MRWRSYYEWHKQPLSRTPTERIWFSFALCSRWVLHLRDIPCARKSVSRFQFVLNTRRIKFFVDVLVSSIHRWRQRWSTGMKNALAQMQNKHTNTPNTHTGHTEHTDKRNRPQSQIFTFKLRSLFSLSFVQAGGQRYSIRLMMLMMVVMFTVNRPCHASSIVHCRRCSSS